MLARSTRRAWEAVGGSRQGLQIAYLATAASTSEAGRKPPQVERAIRVKSQKQKQSIRPEYRDRDRSKDRPLFSKSSLDRSARSLEQRGAGRSLDRSNKDTSIREFRFSVTAKLNALLKDKSKTRDAAFAEGEALFDSLSGFVKREPRIYNAMIRLALRAQKRQLAMKLVTEMKKNGIAPGASTYRAIFEGISRSVSPLNPDENKPLIKDVHNLFDDLEKAWRSAVSNDGKQYGRGEESNEDNTVEASTARSYAESKKSIEMEMLEDPDRFAAACEYYLVFLFSIKAYDQASSLVARVQELASPRGATKAFMKRARGKLPYVLASRFLYECMRLANIPSGLQDTVVLAHNTVIKAIREQKNLFTSPYSNSADGKQERNEVDRALYVAMTALDIFDVPNREAIVMSSVEGIYNTEHLASLPPITIEKTVLRVLKDCENNPTLCLKVFEGALDYNDGVVSNSEDKFLTRDEVAINGLDVIHCWSKAISICLIRLKDLTKALDLIERAKASLKGTSRFSPSEMPRTVVFSNTMRLCAEKQDWNSAVRVWRIFFDTVNMKDSMQLYAFQLFVSRFLTLAWKLERSQSSQANASVTGEKVAAKVMTKYSRKALALVDEDIGLENPKLWSRAETILEAASKKVPVVGEGGEVVEEEGKNKEQDEDVSMCLDYLFQIRQACKYALDTGEQGSNVAEKQQVEKWKEMRQRASQLRSIGEGRLAFDPSEADWLRSGAKGRSSLALSDADMRELLG